jgi:hypothetical protein
MSDAKARASFLGGNVMHALRHGVVLGFFVAILAGGCAYTVVEPVGYDDAGRRGVRYYEPQPLLVATCETVSVAFVPNYNRGYSVQFRSFLARNNTSIQESGGMLSKIAADVDTAPLLSLLEGVGAEALEQAEKLAALGAAGGGFEQRGVWRFDYDAHGNLENLTPLLTPQPCN